MTFASHLGRVLAIIALVALAGPVELTTSAPKRAFFVGVDEDAPKWGRSHSVANVARSLGLKAIRLTVPWQPGESRLSRSDRRVLDNAVSSLRKLRIVVAIYGDRDAAPQDAQARAEFCDFATDVVRRYRSIRDVVIWNEPNSGSFWRPQFTGDGTSVAPAAYEALLATCWSKLHAAARGVNVIAASAPRGRVANANPNPSHAPGAWYKGLGAAYRASKRSKPIFDTIGHNPYPNFTSERPWTRHTAGQSIAQGDHDKLVAALRQAFRNTGQPLPGRGRVTIWYMEQGFQTRPDPGKEGHYSGAENDRFVLPAWSARAGSREGLAPDQATQIVDSIRLAYCQRNVGAYFNFMLADEHDLAGWQSGVLWADWTPKPSYSAFASVIREVETGAVDCAAISRAAPLPAPAEPAPLVISNAKGKTLSPFSATITWRTSLPSDSLLEAALLGSPGTIWEVVDRPRREHSVTLSGLAPSRSYRVWLSAIGPDGQQARSVIEIRTPRLTALQASVARGVGTLLLDGEPFFPLMTWGQCHKTYPESLSAGITLFAENSCGDFADQLRALDGRALSAAVSERPAATAPGVIGYFHPDEADGRAMTAEMLPPAPHGLENGVRFLTLTNHFFSRAAPLGWGRDMYPGLIEASDMVGFDAYPLQEFCNPDDLAQVYDAQRELVQIARGRPTFQWIEAAEWRCPGGPTAVTPTTVRAESWLAIAGGARGLGFFPAYWTPAVGRAIADISRDLARLGPAIFSFSTPVTATSPGGLVKVGARARGDTLYVFAVNTGRTRAEASIRLQRLEGRRVAVLDERRSLSADEDVFTDEFAPFETHIYVIPPADFVVPDP